MAHEQLSGLALKYLDISNPRQPNVALAKDRIFNNDSFRNKQGARPSVPYQVEKIKVHMSLLVQTAQKQ